MSEEQVQEQKPNVMEEHYEVEIVEERENIIFNRKEVKGLIKSSKSTPSKAYVISYLSSKYKVPETHIDLRYVVNKPRVRISEFFALIYSHPIKDEEKKEEGGE